MESTVQEKIAGSEEAIGRPTRYWRFFRRYPILPLIVVIAIIISAVFAPILAPHDPLVGNLRDQDRPPFWQAESPISGKEGLMTFPLGTDPLGRDILSRIIWGARFSMIIAGIVIVTGAIGGTFLGMVAGYFGGLLDEALMRLVDLTLGVPFILVALATVVVFGASITLVISLLILFSWSGFARQVRAETLRLRTADYVLQARIAGASPTRIIARHIVPGVTNTVMVIASLNIGQLILTEATLSFLGVGIPKPNPAWGSMVADGRAYIDTSYWIALFPGIAIFLVSFAFNFLGDWIRDRLDPKLRQL
jgi:peptide/nickel transport system permease protein